MLHSSPYLKVGASCNIFGENHRWNIPATTIFKVEDRLFALDWWEGLTEHQENEFYEQPYEVKEVKKMIEITEYERI